MKFKYLVDDITIDLWFPGNFVSMEHIKRKCNLVVEFSKYSSNKINIEWSYNLKLQSNLLPNVFLLLINFLGTGLILGLSSAAVNMAPQGSKHKEQWATITF